MGVRVQSNIVTSSYTGMIVLADVKEFLRFDGTDQDTVLASMINGAIRLAEAYTQRSFGTKNIITEFIDLPIGCRQKLPLGFHRAVNTVNRIDSDGTATLLVLNEDFTITGLNQFFLRLSNATFSTGVNSFQMPSYRVDFDAGLADPSTVDDLVKQAIYMIISEMFENRENSITMTINDVPQNAKLLLGDFRLR